MIEFDPVLVHGWLCRSARRFPDKEALICGEQRWTYQMLDLYTFHLAKTLLETGLERQERVLILLNNCAEAVISIYATLKASGVFIVLDGSTKAPKLDRILQNSAARIIVTHTSKASVVKEALGNEVNNRRILWVGPKEAIPEDLSRVSLSWDSIFCNIAPLGPREVEDAIRNDFPPCIDVDLASLIYTSATTGSAKGIICTHQNMIAAARSIIQYIGNEQNDIILDVLPLSFDYGLYQIIMAFMFGGTVVLEKSFLYLHNFLEVIAKEGVSGFPVVPTIVAMLLKMGTLDKYDFSSLRYITNTGAALPVKHVRSLRGHLPWVKIFSMFGLTECKRVGYLAPKELDTIPSSVGKAMPNCEAFVVDDRGCEVAPGSIGELTVRGSNVMQGYWNDPELTAATFRPGRYAVDRTLYSGDYFRRDDEGFLYFVGRKDDMIKSRGERISPKEIENVISDLDGVAEVAAVGIPDEIQGHVIKVYVVPANGVELTEKDILQHCRQSMEARMVPSLVQLTEHLPKTANGKIDKRQLRAMET